jgi:CelD/BcsL family acetyltransferase involved in cellulose biosynthesis
MSVELEVRRSLDGLAEEWDALVDQSPSPSPFLRSWWLDAAAEASPRFVVAFDGGSLVGGAAFTTDHRRAVRRYRLLGAALAPHNLDLLAARGYESDVVDAVRGWLGRPGTRIVDLRGIGATALLRRCSPQQARVDRLDSAPYMKVPATFEEYLTSRNKKLRQEIRRVDRRLTEAGVRYREVDLADTDRALETLERLHRARWGRRSLFLGRFPAFAAAARVGAARGEVVFQELTAEGEVISTLVTLELSDCCFFYQTGRDPAERWSNSGTMLRAKAVERSCRRGHRKIDLCIGDVAYKVRWADDEQQVARIRWGQGVLGRIVLAGLAATGPVVDSSDR